MAKSEIRSGLAGISPCLSLGRAATLYVATLPGIHSERLSLAPARFPREGLAGSDMFDWPLCAWRTCLTDCLARHPQRGPVFSRRQPPGVRISRPVLRRVTHPQPSTHSEQEGFPPTHHAILRRTWRERLFSASVYPLLCGVPWDTGLCCSWSLSLANRARGSALRQTASTWLRRSTRRLRDMLSR